MRRPAHIVWRNIGGSGSVILDVESGRYYSLNGTAVAAWMYLESGASVEATASRVAAAYGVKEPEVKRDVEDFVEKLLINGLIEEGTPSAAEQEAKALATGEPYSKPALTIHEAVEKVTGSHGGTHGGGYTYYYYYYYYY